MVNTKIMKTTIIKEEGIPNSGLKITTTTRLNAEEYELLKECLEWNIYNYREKLSNQNIPLSPSQQEKVEAMMKLIRKIRGE